MASSLPQEEGPAQAGQDIAERLDVRVAHIEHLLAAFGAQPSGTRQWLLRWIVEAWPVGQPEVYGSGPHADACPEDPQ